jgi:flavoprotein
LVIAPATSNTVAKCVLGIADSLASNFFAQAGKSRVPILVLPTDVSPEMTSMTPSGREIGVFPRELDLRRADELAGLPGVTVSRSPGELRAAILRVTGL